MDSNVEKLSRDNLWSLEEYAAVREQFRAQVMDHKRSRRVAIGPYASLYFEDFLTMKYQVQEMLRVERIFEAPAIEEEIATYNPLIPDGGNLKATFMIEYTDPTQRQQALARMSGIENTIYLCCGGDKIYAIANEDLERSTEEKAAAVHFLRFELDATTIAAIKANEPVQLGIGHAMLEGSVTLNDAQRTSLQNDLA